MQIVSRASALNIRVHRHSSILLVLIVVGIVLRLWIKVPTDLWEDEIIAVTHAVQPWSAVIVDSIRHDIHPPLYFMQLHMWSLLGVSDLWFMANSILWSCMGIGSLFWVMDKHFGRRTAVAATAAFSVMPSPVYMADQVRMYAMLATLLIWSLHFAIVVFKERDCRAMPYIALILLQVAIILSHALGAVAVLCMGLYAILISGKGGVGYGKWLLCYGIAAAVAVPCAINAALHEGGVQDSATIQGLKLMLSGSMVGVAATINSVGAMTGMALFIGLVVVAYREKMALQFFIIFIAIPLGLALLGNAIQPFYKWNFFSTLEAPFIAIILGLAITGNRALEKIIAAFCLVMLLVVSVGIRSTFRESSKFLAVSQFLRGSYRSGDVIFVPQAGYFHGLAWYLDGARWGSPLRVAAPPSPSWRKVYTMLGQNLVRKLDLMPQTDIIENRPFKLLTGSNPAKDAPNSKRIWLVTANVADLPKGYPPAAIEFLPRQLLVGEHVQVSLYASRPQSLGKSVIAF